MFKESRPVIGTRDIQRAIEFYTTRLGFQLAFKDNAEKLDKPSQTGRHRRFKIAASQLDV
jgi:catechol 2,3-dioxygenase-like lactoylglutathione lyase family enzyme